VNGLPNRQGLYDPRFEKDACGIGLVVDIQGRPSSKTVRDSILLLKNLNHRGAQGADAQTGDGCGILVQPPDRFFRKALKGSGIELPESGKYGVGMVFLPQDEGARRDDEALVESTVVGEGMRFLGWRDVPTVSSVLGSEARRTEPKIRQFFVTQGPGAPLDAKAFERKLYIARRIIENAAKGPFTITSLSLTRLVYKGLLLPAQLDRYFADLADPDFESAIAMVHSRFSTNTFPTWARAHPYRYLCHNGEINTLKGNVNWMRTREGNLMCETLGADLERVKPIVQEDQSDSACLDNVVEFLVMGGRSLPHAMMMLIPEPWVGSSAMDEDRRAFYEYHAAMMEPWDGPAAVCFTDGSLVGATLDRNGLRPCRYLITVDQRLVLASEAGALPIDPDQVQEKGRIEPGKMLIVDTLRGQVMRDDEIKSMVARQRPYKSWLNRHRIQLSELPAPKAAKAPPRPLELPQRQALFGYTEEEFKTILLPMSLNGEEPVSSMGIDTPLAILSERPQLLFSYFKQLFAQVTNPPIDPIREKLVMSLATSLGPKANLMLEAPEACRRIRVDQPILTDAELAKIRAIKGPHFRARTLSLVFEAAQGPAALETALEAICDQAVSAVREGYQFLILSDREAGLERAAIPSLLGVSAVHQRLIREKLRTEVGIVVESAEPRDVHHFACLIGFGAGSVNPYLALETIVRLGGDPAKYTQAIGKGLLKIFSKMGISTVQSYCGAQLFQAVGIDDGLIDRYFTGTASSRLGGLDALKLGEEVLRRHSRAIHREPGERALDPGGDIHYRIQGESHEWSPEVITSLQKATRENDAASFKEFSDLANRVGRGPAHLRGLLELSPAKDPVPLREVEPAREIVKRFTTGAMSLGAISKEAHETLAVAMNRMGARSNTGEGGEDPGRFVLRENGDSANSAIKQVASARFGVTIHYLSNAREIQIKMAQGAKPGEGGQLPGHKVDENIGKLRFSTPGVQLISPPPHHDIYSIEDLKQLIFDLRNANPEAVISVKLVAEAGVGVVAAGVAKALADKILISGDSGGTGASPLSSIRNAGVPWELGLAETHQTLVLNGLRSSVRLETDGLLRTGRDVAIAAMLGAEEFGFATAPLVVEGCLMMRKCHLNTCPVGIATQDPELRAKFAGKPEHVINYFFFVAEELREIMATLGFRTVDEMVGRTDRLKPRKLEHHWKASTVDVSALLHRAAPRKPVMLRKQGVPRPLGEVLDHKLVESSITPLARGQKVELDLTIRNTDRATGTLLSGQIVTNHGAEGLAPDTITVRFRGSAGQSFGAFLAPGITLRLEGEANDYVGKGLSGGKVAIFPPGASASWAGFDRDGSILIGNTSLYGATWGEAFIAGKAGERFAVRNSGAVAVVEGVGDHGCEYMTGGMVVILGPTGRNFAAGMSGGVAYVLDEEEKLVLRCNPLTAPPEDIVDPNDEAVIHERIEAHFAMTQSPRAREILDRWGEYRAKFRKVIPAEYKQALEKSPRLKVVVISPPQGAARG
jgi:glutamate synthase (NADPH) large chain